MTTADATPSENQAPTGKPLLRLRWLLVPIVLINAIGLWLIWSQDDAMMQNQWLTSVVVVGGSGVLLLAWAVVLSGWQLRSRLLVVGVVALAVGGAAIAFEFDGVNGNLIPIPKPRFGGNNAPALPTPVALKPTNTGDTTKPNGINTSDVAPPTPPAKALHDGVLLKDYPQFLGPNRNLTLDGPALNADWKANRPKEIWRQPIGAGWSAFAVKGNLAVTQEQREQDECVTCYDIHTGDLLWLHKDAARYATGIAGVGPRATPTIDGDLVYTHGATGILNCLDLKTGEVKWTNNFAVSIGAKQLEWGNSASPLVAGDNVIINAGGTDGRMLVAMNKTTGEQVWAAGDDHASYSSPVLTKIAGLEQIVLLNHSSVTGHDPATGKILWQHPWPAKPNASANSFPKVAQPLPVPGDRLFVSSGYGVGGAMFQLARDEAGQWSVKVPWTSMKLKAKFANMTFMNGNIYGFDDGILACVEAATGDRLWKGGRYGHGQMIRIKDRLLIQAETGELVLVAASPDDLDELARIPALNDNTWNSPTLAGQFLLLRNHREVVCYILPIDK